MNSSPIGVFDSGVGGLSLLRELQRLLPNEDFIYYGDRENAPYGAKTHKEILDISKGIVDELLARGAKAIVVACNTASTVVKPKNAFMLKPNLDDLNSQSTLILCTPATEKALRLKEKGYKTADTKNLATAVEILCETAFKSNDFSCINHLENHLKTIIDNGIEKRKIDTIYLGCSHYLYFKKIIEALYPDIEILDGNKRLINDLKSSKIPQNGHEETAFDFTLGNQRNKYTWLLSKLEDILDISDI